MPERLIISWSGGKDCSFALYEIKQNPQYEIVGLFSTINEKSGKINLHETGKSLIQRQADVLGLPLDLLQMPVNPSNEYYIQHLRQQFNTYYLNGISKIVFADIFLDDIRNFRLNLMKDTGIEAMFPLWKKDSGKIAGDFIRAGFKAIVCSVDISRLDASFAGREFNDSFLKDLPSHIDPCGENGEFHTFVYDGPVFKNKLHLLNNGCRLIDDRFYYCDIQMKKE